VDSYQLLAFAARSGLASFLQVGCESIHPPSLFATFKISMAVFSEGITLSWRFGGSVSAFIIQS